jgi:hypothetical protein
MLGCVDIARGWCEKKKTVQGFWLFEKVHFHAIMKPMKAIHGKGIMGS